MGPLDGRWLTVVDHARDVVAAVNAGRAGPGYERMAAYEVLKLAEEVKPREVVETGLAMFMMQELEPRRFRSDAAFRFQLVRRVRALGDVNVGEYFDDETGKMKRVYREFSREPQRSWASGSPKLSASRAFVSRVWRFKRKSAPSPSA